MITRALGPEPNVQVDILEEPAHAGDLFMLCSDGLTSMVREPDLVPLLVGEDRSLDDIGRGLIAAANATGGRDNITVVLFRLEEIDAPAGSRWTRPPRRTRSPTTGHERVRDLQRRGRRRAAPGRQPAHGPHARDGRRPRPGQRRRGRPSTGPPGTVALSAVRPRAQPIDEDEERNHAPPRRQRRRKGVRRLFSPGKLIALGCLAGLLAAFWLATRQVYFVGVDDSRGNVVTLYHGPAVRTPARHRALLSRSATPA